MKQKNTILIRRRELAALGINVSSTTLLRWESRGRFPRRVRLAGTTVAWLKHEIDQWIEDRAAERVNHHYAEF